jgi:hypothetical protein
MRAILARPVPRFPEEFLVRNKLEIPPDLPRKQVYMSFDLPPGKKFQLKY